MKLTAKELLKQAIEINPNHANANNNLGMVFDGLGEIKKAIGCFQKAIKIQPNNTSILNNLGTASKEMGELNEAISFYKKVLEIDSNNVNANFNLGLIFYNSHIWLNFSNLGILNKFYLIFTDFVLWYLENRKIKNGN